MAQKSKRTSTPPTSVLRPDFSPILGKVILRAGLGTFLYDGRALGPPQSVVTYRIIGDPEIPLTLTYGIAPDVFMQMVLEPSSSVDITGRIDRPP